ncbi:unnamed protein product [Amoebophrya sp. A120]|nr:unnamed protein product [Amoebophrya sp. A120]|eukprot:GSA120T00024659001.1
MILVDFISCLTNTKKQKVQKRIPMWYYISDSSRLMNMKIKLAVLILWWYSFRCFLRHAAEDLEQTYYRC